MAEIIKVPDIGDFNDVEVIDVLVKEGDSIERETPLITLESDKAAMDIPSTCAGSIAKMHLKAGDKVNQGDQIATVDTAATAAKPAAETAAPASKAPSKQAAAAPVAQSPAPQAAASKPNNAGYDTEMLVIGAGPGGYSAAFRAADLGMQTTLIEKQPTLGGVCLNVGCIPSKALLHAAKIIRDSEEAAECGISYGKPKTDIKKLRAWTEKIIGKLTSGLSGLAKQRKVQLVHGTAKFIDAHTVQVSDADGKQQTISFANAIIATGSRIIHLPIEPDDPRILDSTSALLLEKVPKHMLVIGGGIIGLEMATVYGALGSQITVVEMTNGLLGGADPDLARVLQKRMKNQGVNFMMQTKVEKITAAKQHITVSTDKEDVKCDAVLVAVGRRPDAGALNLQAAGISTNERGFIPCDDQQRTCVPHIYAIGDIVGQPMLAHKAVHEGHLAAEVACGHKAGFDDRVIPSVAYTEPEVAWVGLTENEAKAKGIKYGKGVFPWAASGRAMSMNASDGSTKLLFDPDSNKLLGAGIVGVNAGDLIAEAVLALETNCDAEDIGLCIHPHPTLAETTGMAAEAYAGTLTDLYIPKRRK